MADKDATIRCVAASVDGNNAVYRTRAASANLKFSSDFEFNAWRTRTNPDVAAAVDAHGFGTTLTERNRVGCGGEDACVRVACESVAGCGGRTKTSGDGSSHRQRGGGQQIDDDAFLILEGHVS